MVRAVDELLEAFHSGTSPCSAASRLDLLLDLERSHDPRVLPVLLQIMGNPREPRAARIGALKQLRNGQVVPTARPRCAAAMVDLLGDRSDPPVRLQALLALGNFTDVDGVLEALGGVALGAGESVELRYAAFTALERAEPSPAYLSLLRQLADDELLGRVASGALRIAAEPASAQARSDP